MRSMRRLSSSYLSNLISSMPRERAANGRPNSAHPIVSVVLSVNSKFPAQALLRSFIRYCRCREEQRMSAASEKSPAKDPLDALYALSRRPTERAEQPRLAAVSEPPIARVPRPEMPRPMTSLSERLENAVAASVAVPIAPPVRPRGRARAGRFQERGRRRALIASVIGVGAAVAVASVVALLFVNIFPKDRDPDQSFAAAVQPAASQARPANDTAKAPLSQVRVPVVGKRWRPEPQPRAVRTAAAAIRAMATEGRFNRQTKVRCPGATTMC